MCGVVVVLLVVVDGCCVLGVVGLVFVVCEGGVIVGFLDYVGEGVGVMWVLVEEVSWSFLWFWRLSVYFVVVRDVRVVKRKREGSCMMICLCEECVGR